MSTQPELDGWDAFVEEHATAPITFKMVDVIVRPLYDFVKSMNAKNIERNDRITSLEQRVAELESRPVLRDAGVWKAGTLYHEGEIVTHDGSGWICRKTHVSNSASNSIDHSCFRLFVTRGKDGRPR
jgi:hypothetical protein